MPIASQKAKTLLQIRQLYKNVLCQFDEDEDCPVPNGGGGEWHCPTDANNG
jgi:hypothetical protein